MGQTFPAAVRARLDEMQERKTFSVVKRVLLVRDYFNADTRLLVDVSDDVVKWGQVVNQSTIKSVDWKVASYTFSVKNLDGKYSTDHAASIWQATFQREPEECAVIFLLLLPMPDGSLYQLQRYAGGIDDCVPREEADMAVVDLVTKHLSHGPLSQKITKASGDELVKIGTSW